MKTTKIDSSSKDSLRDVVIQKLDKLSTEQLSSVCQFVEFLEYKQQPIDLENPQTNKEIDRVVEI